MAVIAVIFIFGVTWMSMIVAMAFRGSFVFMLAVDAAAVCGAYGLYSLWDNRPIKLRCESCGNIVLSNTPWVCGFCGGENRNTEEFSFLNRCGRCGAEPKTYKCHHSGCRAPMIFLTEDHLKENYAHCLNATSEAKPADEHAEELKKLRQKKEKTIEKRDIASVDEELKAIRKRIREANVKTKKAKERVQEMVDAEMDLEEAQIELLALYKEKYKNNPAMLRRMKAALEDSVRRQKADGT